MLFEHQEIVTLAFLFIGFFLFLDPRPGRFLLFPFAFVALTSLARLFSNQPGISEWTQVARQYSIAYGLVWLTLGTCFLFTASVFWARQFLVMLAASEILFMTFWSFILPLNQNAIGILANSSMDPCLLAITLPFLLEFVRPKYPRFAEIILVWGVLLTARTTSSMGLLSMACVFSGVAVLWYGKKALWGLAGLGVSAFMLIFSMKWHGYLLHMTERTQTWRWVWDWWTVNGHQMTGEGVGSFYGLGRWIQYQAGYRAPGDWFAFLHSDIFQLLFETGVLGVFLTGVWTIYVFRFAFRHGERYALVSALAVLAASTANSPFRYGLVCFSIVCVGRVLLEGVRNEKIYSLKKPTSHHA